ncbi:MAG: lipocalin family protein [Sphingobacteriales bacterium]|nr:lipocalin family protein [Sphingobacteriales bacterium]
MSHTMNHWGKLTIILFLGIATCLTSCQKEPKEDPEPTKKELLVNKWTVLDVLAPNNISVIGLDIAQIKCLKDNIFTIAANGTYTIDEGTVVCDPSSAGSGSWTLTENDSKLTFTPNGGGDPLVFTLIDVNSTTLKVSYEMTDIPLPGTYTVVLQKQ